MASPITQMFERLRIIKETVEANRLAYEKQQQVQLQYERRVGEIRYDPYALRQYGAAKRRYEEEQEQRKIEQQQRERQEVIAWSQETGVPSSRAFLIAQMPIVKQALVLQQYEKPVATAPKPRGVGLPSDLVAKIREAHIGETPAEYRSRYFYTTIGFPEYAGKYEPFEVPSGYVVSGIVETPVGLEVSLTPKPAPPSLTEQFLGTISGWQEAQEEKMFRQIPTRGFDVLAFQRVQRGAESAKFVVGTFASVESLALSVGHLAGVPGLPSPPPTVFGEAVGTVFGRGMSSEEFLEKYGVGYGAGTVAGDILLGYGIGKVGSAVISKTARLIPSSIKEPVVSTVKFSRVTKAFVGVKESVSAKIEAAWRGSRVERWLSSKFGVVHPITKELYPSVGEVVTPMPSASLVPYKMTGKTVSELWLKQQAVETAWALQLAPKTGGVWIGRAIPELGRVGTQTVMGAFFVEGKLVGLYWKKVPTERLSFVQPESRLTPLVSQQHLTRIGIYPHIPTVTALAKKTTLTSLVLPLPLVGIVKAKREKQPKQILAPKISIPSFEFMREKLRPFTVSEAKRVERKKFGVVPILAFGSLPQLKIGLPSLVMPTIRSETVTGTIAKSETATIVKQVSKQAVKTIQLTVPSVPTKTKALPTPTLPTYPIRLPKQALGKIKTHELGAWFKRTHPIKTSKQMAETFGLTEKGRKKRRSTLLP